MVVRGRSELRWNDAERTLMMWTDLHRGYLARMKKCISTEKSRALWHPQISRARFVQTKNRVGYSAMSK
jgi:hypothetical protein